MLAIIPARGGSKGIPGKNIKLLAGVPLINYTIKAAREAGIFSRIVVSTDSEEIAKVAREAGAEIPFLRPAQLATDDSPAIETYLFTLNNLESKSSVSIDEVAILQPTTPLRSSFDIQEAYRLFTERDAESVISYTKELHPVTWHKYVTENLKFEDIFEPNNLANRQAVKPSYYPNGAIFIFKKEILQKRKYYSENSFAYIMPRERSVDIDDVLDFEYAEFLLTKFKS